MTINIFQTETEYLGMRVIYNCISWKRTTKIPSKQKENNNTVLLGNLFFKLCNLYFMLYKHATKQKHYEPVLLVRQAALLNMKKNIF